MFRTLKVPILGIVENMSSIKCSNCGHDVHLFESQLEKVAEAMAVNILERIPIGEQVATGCDSGAPVAIKFPDSDQGKCFHNLAKEIVKLIEENKIRN